MITFTALALGVAAAAVSRVVFRVAKLETLTMSSCPDDGGLISS